jgi:hypothetical protein
MKSFRNYITEVMEPAGAPFEKLFQLGALTHYRSRIPREDDSGHHLVDTSIVHRKSADPGVADVSFKVDDWINNPGYKLPFAHIYGAVLDHVKDFLKSNPNVHTIIHNTDNDKKTKLYDLVGKKFGMTVKNTHDKSKQT